MELFSVMKGCGNRSNSHDTVQLGYATLFFDTLEYMERNQGGAWNERGETRGTADETTELTSVG